MGYMGVAGVVIIDCDYMMYYCDVLLWVIFRHEGGIRPDRMAQYVDSQTPQGMSISLSLCV